MRAPRAAMLKAMHRTHREGETVLAAVLRFTQRADTPVEALIAWEAVTEFVRIHPDIEKWAAPIGLTDDDRDALFALAMEIERNG